MNKCPGCNGNGYTLESRRNDYGGQCVAVLAGEEPGDMYFTDVVCGFCKGTGEVDVLPKFKKDQEVYFEDKKRYITSGWAIGDTYLYCLGDDIGVNKYPSVGEECIYDVEEYKDKKGVKNAN